jgi:hypothetical protein
MFSSRCTDWLRPVAMAQATVRSTDQLTSACALFVSERCVHSEQAWFVERCLILSMAEERKGRERRDKETETQGEKSLFVVVCTALRASESSVPTFFPAVQNGVASSAAYVVTVISLCLSSVWKRGRYSKRTVR